MSKSRFDQTLTIKSNNFNTLLILLISYNVVSRRKRDKLYERNLKPYTNNVSKFSVSKIGFQIQLFRNY